MCFVCLGNICRSPTAEGVFRALVQEAGLAGRVEVASAGTAAYHEGEPADPRTRAAAAARGVRLQGRARRFRREDFDRFDYVIALDRDNERDLLRLAAEAGARERIHRLRSFDPLADTPDVPDPYEGGADAFERVFELCEAACRGLLEHLASEHGLRR